MTLQLAMMIRMSIGGWPLTKLTSTGARVHTCSCQFNSMMLGLTMQTLQKALMMRNYHPVAGQTSLAMDSTTDRASLMRPCIARKTGDSLRYAIPDRLYSDGLPCKALQDSTEHWQPLLAASQCAVPSNLKPLPAQVCTAERQQALSRVCGLKPLGRGSAVVASKLEATAIHCHAQREATCSDAQRCEYSV